MNRKQRRAGAKGRLTGPSMPPPDIGTAFGLALSLHRAGRLVEAEAAYGRVLALDPGHAESWHQLGMIALAAGRDDLAIDLIGRALAINPGEAWYHCNLGGLLHRRHRLDEAALSLRRAIILDPRSAEAHNNLGSVRHEQGGLDEALACFQQALEVEPGYVEAWTNRGIVLKDLGRLDEAAESFGRALALRPDHPEAHNGLANVVKEWGRLDEALAGYGRALGLRPGYVEAMTNLGTVLKELGRMDEALACYARALELAPDYPEVHWNRAFALLSDGRYREGWEEYEWRWRRSPAGRMPHPAYPQPNWTGEPGQGRTILLWSEQGFGDGLHFIRFAPLVARRGWTVVVQTVPALRRLFQTMPGIEVVGTDEALPPFDVQCSLLSLPRVLGVTGTSIPAEIPYLHPQPELNAAWRQRLAGWRGLKLGVAWRGNPGHHRDRHRSVGPDWFGSILDMDGIDVVSLHPDGRPDEFAALGCRGQFLDPSRELGDYADTAALIAALDLVISVDSSVCHLAGALGVPVWTLLDYAPDWRWLRGRGDTPWYPTMRLLRQPAPGDWHAVAREARGLLAALPARPV